MMQEKREKQAGPAFAELLQAAVTEPGIVSEAYSAFHSYSIGNQIAALIQCRMRGVPVGPLATFPGWKGRGRHVKRGERALVLCQPVTMKRTERDQASGEEREHCFTRFVWRASWFTLYQTDGEPFAAPAPIKAWDRARALEALGIAEEPFDHADGNVQGYAKARSIAVSPVAALTHMTTFHELAHIVLGHTAETALSDTAAPTPRDVREVEAEAVAFLLCATLELPGLAESRGYLQAWLNGGTISERSAQRIYSAANSILAAGRDGVAEAGAHDAA
jgi:hypothetical protein